VSSNVTSNPDTRHPLHFLIGIRVFLKDSPRFSMSESKSYRSGQELNGYRIISRIGFGGYGAIYFAEFLETGQKVALKVETINQKRKALRYEAMIYTLLRRARYVARCQRYVESETCLTLAMECLGPSLSRLKRQCRRSRFSLSTTLRIGVESVRALKELHGLGLVHRDLKPGNMAVRPSRRRPIALIDFGLARRFIDPDTNEPIPRREHPGFVGTPGFASVNALRGRELSQRDDLWSLLYTLIVLRTGTLPWRDAGSNREVSLALRLSTPPEKLCAKCPRQFLTIYRVISACHMYEVPNYDLLMALLCEAMAEGGCQWSEPYDWELLPKKKMNRLSPLEWVIPEREKDPMVPTGLPDPVVPGELEEVDDCEEGDAIPRDPICGGCSLFLCGC
jgi:serine/threonine protein kinase